MLQDTFTVTHHGGVTEVKLDDLIETSIKLDGDKYDLENIEAKALRFDPADCRLVLPEQAAGLFVGGATVPPVSLNEWAYRQVFEKLGPVHFGPSHKNKMLPADYLLAAEPALRAYNLNWQLERAENKRWLIRCQQDTARAVLDKSYARIDNTKVLDAFQEAQRRKDGGLPGIRLIRPYVDHDAMHLKAVWADAENGRYGLGVYVRNGEIGNYNLYVYPMIVTWACTNGCIVSTLDEEIGVLKQIHRGDPAEIMAALKITLARVMRLSDQVRERMVAAEAERLPDFEDVLNGLAAEHKWDRTTYTAVALGTEGRRTRLGLVEGITYAAHTVTNGNAEAETQMEMMGGRYLMAPEGLFGRLAARGRLAGAPLDLAEAVAVR